MRRRRKFMNRRKKRTVGTYYGFSRSLFLSVLGVLLCMICLVSTTWAWFTDSVGSGGSMIKAANYDLAVVVETTDSADITDNGGGQFSLTANKEYKITLTPTGDATTGYCKVTAGDTTYYTEQIAKGTVFVFQLIPPVDPANVEGKCTVSFEAQWGTYSGSDGNKVQSGSTIGNIVLSEENNPSPQDNPNTQDSPNPQDNPGGQDTTDTQVSPNPEGAGENPDTPDENSGGSNGNSDGQDETSDGQDETSGGQDGTSDGQGGTSGGQSENSGGQAENAGEQGENSGGSQETPGNETPSDGEQTGQSDDSTGASEGVAEPVP